MEIGCKFDSDSGLCISSKGDESWYYFDNGGVSLYIPLFIDTRFISFYFLVQQMCICVYVLVVNTVIGYVINI